MGRLHRHAPGAPRNDGVARFWFFVDKNGPTVRDELGQCWTWTGAFSKGGKRKPSQRYGAHTINGKRTSAHRHAWAINSGQMPPSTTLVRHKCDNASCVNPSHLELGTPLDNMRDMVERGRAYSGRPRVNGRFVKFADAAE